ncbi:MAG: LysM peptidoglycan-binding domain-containing protein [Bryobacterales bacterium]|nr:LysM peptidoglycan-binding domain-containing protein [Bryobacterales bacterium]
MRVESGSSQYKVHSDLSCIAKKGDTLAQIAKSTGAPLDEILRLNPKLKNPNQALAAGAEVVLPQLKSGGKGTQVQRGPDGSVKDNLATHYPKAVEHRPAAKTETPAAYGAPISPHEPKPETPKPAARAADTSVSDSMARERLNRAKEPLPAGAELPKDLGDHAVEKNKWVAGGRDILDTGKGAVDLRIGTLTKQAGELGTRMDRLRAGAEGVEKRMGLLLDELSKTTNKFDVDKLRGDLSKVMEEGRVIQKELKGALGEFTEVSKDINKLSKLSGKMEPIADLLGNTKKIATTLGKLAVPLDVYSNFQDFEKANPGHSGQNLTKAAVSVATKLAVDLKTAGSLANVSETAVGALKFVLETAGLKDTPAYETVDLASQAFPVDVAGKVVANLTDLAFASNDYRKGDAKAMSDLLDANLQGKNGQVVQGIAVLGDLVMTGGENIPTNDEALKMAYLFQNPGHTEVPLERTGRTGREKAAILDQVMDGPKTAPNDVVRIQNIVAQSTPDQLKTVFERVSPESLVRSLPTSGEVRDPVTTTFLDLSKVAGSSASGKPDAPIWGQLDRYLREAQRQGHTEVFDQLRQRLEQGQLKQLPGWLRQNIRHGY